MKLSIVIPVRNEEEVISGTVVDISEELNRQTIDHEIIVVNDNSTDQTEKVLKDLVAQVPFFRYMNNSPPGGFGRAVRFGLDFYTGDCVAVYMGDGCDSPSDLVAFYRKMVEGGYDAVFGSRFIAGSKTADYPYLKYFINRMANQFIRLLFGLRYNDITNAFKLYRRETIDGLKPFLSPQFNLTVELSLKTIVRGYSYTWIPNSWTNRRGGVSKLRIKEMGSRYLFIIFYCFIEKYLTRGDYQKKSGS